jgi:predicted PurR-regulated permease PerM
MCYVDGHFDKRRSSVRTDKELRLALKIVLTAAAVIILSMILVKVAPIMTIFVSAIFIVYCINPLVNFLISKRIQPLLAAIVSSLIVFIALALFFYLLIPGLVEELRQLALFAMTDMLDELAGLVVQLEEIDQRFNLQLSNSFLDYYDQFTREVPVHVQHLLRGLTNFSMILISRAWVVLALAFLAFYLVQDMEKAKTNLTLLFPHIYQKEIIHILGIIDQKVGAFIRGTLLKSLFVGTLTGFGLSLLGMPFALMLGILAGGLNIILYIGPVLATIPALLLSIAPGTPSFFLVLALYIFVQILDAFVFTPVLLGKAVDLSPLTVVVVVLIGGQLMGLLGIILSIPITAILKVLLVHYYLDKNKISEN